MSQPKLNRHWPVTSLPLRVTPEPLYVNLPPVLPAKVKMITILAQLVILEIKQTFGWFQAGSYRSRPSSSYPFHWNKGMEETILKISSMLQFPIQIQYVSNHFWILQEHEPQSVLNHLDWTKLSQGRHAEPLPPPLSRPNNQNSNDYMNSRNPSTLKCRTLRTTLA